LHSPARAIYGRHALVDIDIIRKALHEHILAEILLRTEPLAPDEDLFDAGFDSMSLSRILVFVEERFGVVIPDEDVVVDDMATLESMSQLVARYLERT
jgi:acyl carrier protein